MDGGEVAEPEPRPVVPIASDHAQDIAALVNDSRCRLHRGVGSARDVGAAVLADSAVSRFLVFGSGTAFAGRLPFRIDRVQIGRLGDGALAAAFGGVGDERLAVLLNGRTMADERGVVDFGLSRGGAEWFLVRRLSNGEFGIEQRDTATGAERATKGSWLRDTAEGLSHTAAYSLRTNVLIFTARHPDDSFENSHYLLGVDGKVRIVRLVRVEAIFESEAHIYVLQKVNPGTHDISKLEFRWSAPKGEKQVEVWSRQERLAPATVEYFLSEDAAWLGLFGWNLAVLDTRTGTPTFLFPVRLDKGAELERLASVLDPEATVADVGQATSAGMAQGFLLVRRTVPLRETPDNASKDVVDMFRLDSLQMESQPDFRVEAADLARCVVNDPGFPLPSIQLHLDGFTFGVDEYDFALIKEA